MKKIYLSAMFIGLTFVAFSQDDLLKMVNEGNEDSNEDVFATFKTYKLCNSQTIETVKKGHLDYRIAHRFGNLYNTVSENPLNEAAHSSFGFDVATDLRNSLDYGILNNLTVGLGRSRFRETVDGNVKWRFLTQKQNFKIPVSVAFFGDMAYTTMSTAQLYNGVVKDFPTEEAHRVSYFSQLIIACKINSGISVQMMPSYLHRNYIKQNFDATNSLEDVNDLVSLGFSARVKITKRTCIVADYFYNFSPFYQNNPFAQQPLSGVQAFAPLALGFEMETGGHVFSLFFTNASALIENNYLPYTTDNWGNSQVKFGFCISRSFSLVNKEGNIK